MQDTAAHEGGACHANKYYRLEPPSAAHQDKQESGSRNPMGERPEPESVREESSGVGEVKATLNKSILEILAT